MFPSSVCGKSGPSSRVLKAEAILSPKSRILETLQDKQLGFSNKYNVKKIARIEKERKGGGTCWLNIKNT